MLARLSALAASAALLACATPTPKLPPVSDRYDYRGYLARCPSGLRVLALDTGNPRRAVIAASYGAGVRDDPPGKPGTARFAVHLARWGARGEGGLSAAERLYGAGAISASSAEAEDVEFHDVGRPSHLDTLIAIEADRLRDPLGGIAEREFADAREAFARELEHEAAAPSYDAQRAWVEDLAVGVDTRPSPAAIRELTLEDVRAWAKAHLVPSRLILAVAAPLDPKLLAARVQVAFGSLATGAPQGSTTPLAPPVDAPPARDLLERRAAVDEPVLWLAWRLEDTHDTGVAARLAAAALEVLLRIRISERDLRTAANDVSVELSTRHGVPVVTARVDLRSESDARRVRDALADPLGPGRTDASIETALWAAGLFGRGAIRAEALRSMEEGDIGIIARHVRTTGRADFLSSVERELAASVDAKGAVQQIRSWFRAERCAALLVAPGTDAAAPKEGVATAWFVDSPLTAPGAAGLASFLEPPGLDAAIRARLPNGLEVAILPRPALPTVEARLVIRTDARFSKPVITAALAAARKSWTLAGSWDCLGSSGVVGAGHVTFIGRGAASAIEPVLAELQCRIASRRADEQRLDAARRAFQDTDSSLRRHTTVRGAAAFFEGLYPDMPIPQSVDAEAAAAFLRDGMRPDRSMLVVAGRIPDPQSLLAVVARQFGGWSARGAAPEASTSAAPRPRRAIVADVPDARRALVLMGLRLGSRADPDHAARLALRAHVERILTARLRPRGAHLSSWEFSRPDSPSLLYMIEIDAALAFDALRIVLDELDQLRRTAPSQSATNTARWLAGLTVAYSFDTTAGAADGLADLFARGLPLDAWERLPASLSALDPAQLHAAARAAGLGSESILVAGDATAFAAALERAGIPAQVIRDEKVKPASAPAR